MSEFAVRTEGLGKEYRRGMQLQTYKTAREAITNSTARLFRRSPITSVPREFWALRDVTFELEQGEALGIVGRNGAGKTTLLKVLSQITRPTAGRAEVRGRVGTLLEVGTGFHPELTGRENIRLSGAILGMSRSQIGRRFDEIVDFAEVEQFIDTPVKRYSTGMFMRLAFSVAAHLEPDILIVDEVLAVGDAAFQKKCLGKLGSVGVEGRTVIFVSHNMNAVEQFCTRGLLLEGGEIRLDAPISQVVQSYLGLFTGSSADALFEVHDETVAASIVRISSLSGGSERVARFRNDEPIALEVEWVARRPLRDDHVSILLYRSDGLLLLKASDDDWGNAVSDVREPGRYVTRFRLPGSVLNEGVYQFRVSIGKRRAVHHDDQYGQYFEVEDATDYRESDFGKRNGVLLVPFRVEEERTGSFV